MKYHCGIYFDYIKYNQNNISTGTSSKTLRMSTTSTSTVIIYTTYTLGSFYGTAYSIVVSERGYSFFFFQGMSSKKSM